MGRLILVSIAVAILLLIYGMQRLNYKEKIASGELADRKDIFLKQRHTFFFHQPITPKKLVEQLNHEKLAEYHFQIQENEGVYFFIFTDSNAVLYDQESTAESDEIAIAFELQHYKSNTEMMLLPPYNFLLTDIERVAKQLDDSVEVQRIVKEFVTTYKK